MIDQSKISQMSAEDYQEYIEKNRWKHTLQVIVKDWRLYVLLLPMVLVFFFWRYLPLYGVLIAFKNFKTNKGVFGSDFYGLKYFKDLMFADIVQSYLFWRAFRNTFLLSFYGLLFGFPIPIILALFFSEIKSDRYRSIVQIFSYLPRFVSTVVVTSIIAMMLKEKTSVTDPGILTKILQDLSWIPTKTKDGKEFAPLMEPAYFRSIYQISGVWESAGYGSIVFFASIMAISPTSYEAARIDGANKIQQIRYVTLPGMASTLIIMLVLRIGDLLTIGYEKVLLLYNSNTYETADVISTFVFRMGMSETGAIPGLAAAADFFNSLIAMFLVIGSNFIARKVSDTSLY